MFCVQSSVMSNSGEKLLWAGGLAAAAVLVYKVLRSTGFTDLEEESTVQDVKRHLVRLDGFEEANEGVKGRSDGQQVYTVVLTGGPCAGKTTALARISTYLTQRGFRIFTVPEAATMLFSHGVAFADLASEHNVENFQGNLLLTQLHLEDTFFDLAANTGQPCVVLCDRGAMDGSVYIEPHIWDNILKKYDFDRLTLRDKRYNAVFHLVTAADGAEKFYTLENNHVRHESAEQARELDKKLQEAWVGHPKLMVFKNLEGGFEDKLQRVISSIGQLCGLPDCQRSSLKFLLTKMPEHIPVNHEIFLATKIYLVTPSPISQKGKNANYSFVRKRSTVGKNGERSATSYQLTTCTFDDNGQKIEVKRILRKRSYLSAVKTQADSSRNVITQRRTTFLWKSQYFEIYQYLDENITLLTCQNVKGDSCVLPPFVKVDKDVTGNDAYSAYELSLKKKSIAGAFGFGR